MIMNCTTTSYEYFNVDNIKFNEKYNYSILMHSAILNKKQLQIFNNNN